MNPSTVEACARAFAQRFGDRHRTRTWWSPGRVELLGKHVDYAGGRSLLAAIDRGLVIIARPRSDAHVNLFDARTGQTFLGELRPDLPHSPGRWTDYPISVLRRVARDFPGAGHGMDAAIASDLPSAAGLSSSSALVIATFLPLADFNDLATRAEWPGGKDPATLAGYLGAMENGRAYGNTPADFGVGTQGGSQDHLAILCGEAGRLTQARFLPAAVEARAMFPDAWQMVVASSGVPAPKGSAVREQYNALAKQAAILIGAWQESVDPAAISLLDILMSNGESAERLRRLVRDRPDREALDRRLEQFRTETMDLVPRALDAARTGDVVAMRQAITSSYELGRSALENQVAPTVRLTEGAMAAGAIAASPFGAGFGGSVYAIVERAIAADFTRAWASGYTAEFPELGGRADFFVTEVADGAREIVPA